MNWRNLIFIALWITVVILLLFPTICTQWSICEKSTVPLVILLGIVGAVLALSDAVRVRRAARENLFGPEKKDKAAAPDTE